MTRIQAASGCSAVELCEYIAKCLAGVTVAYLLLIAFPHQKSQCLWLLISMLLSITHDNDSKVARHRMRANIIGPLVGLIMFLLIPPPSLPAVFIGVVLTVLICFKLNLMQPCRTALVGLIIVMAYEKTENDWMGAIYRMSSVVAGCLIALLLNYLFRHISSPVLQWANNRNRSREKNDSSS